MARILYTWELGDNYGHMSSFAGIAEELAKRGHEVVVVLQNLSEAAKFFGHINVRYFQAPVWKKKQAMAPRPALTYADLIRSFGYEDAAGLATMLSAWQELVKAIAPDLIVLDSSPTALLATRDMGIKRVAYGPGYAIPPATTPLPNLRIWQKVPPAEIKRREDAAIEVINQAAEKSNISPIKDLRDLFQTDDQCLLTLQELDHYERRESADYLGPRFNVDTGDEVQWPDVYEKKLFAYIRPDSKFFVELLAQLKEYPVNAVISAPGIPEKLKDKYEAPHLHFSSTPVRIAQMQKECDAAICHAGQGTVAAFLLAGVPMILFPNHLEQLLVARRAIQLGAAMMPKPDTKEVPYVKMLNHVFQEHSFKERAKSFAEKYQEYDLQGQTVSIAERLEALI